MAVLIALVSNKLLEAQMPAPILKPWKEMAESSEHEYPADTFNGNSPDFHEELGVPGDNEELIPPKENEAAESLHWETSSTTVKLTVVVTEESPCAATARIGLEKSKTKERMSLPFFMLPVAITLSIKHSHVIKDLGLTP
jgi:hypothetical protein